MAACSMAATYAEGEGPVGRGVGHRGQQQRNEVRGLGTHRRVQHQVQQGVRESVCHAYDSEADQLTDHACGDTGHQRLATERGLQFAQWERSGRQSTGTSWIRKPARSAMTSSSVSKNQPVSITSGRSCRATSARIALKPHCTRRIRASDREPPATTPTAANRWRCQSERTPTVRPTASAPRDRSTGRRPPATTEAVDDVHAARSAPPRPLASKWMTFSCGSSSASRLATSRVPSVLALSTRVIRAA